MQLSPIRTTGDDGTSTNASPAILNNFLFASDFKFDKFRLANFGFFRIATFTERQGHERTKRRRERQQNADAPQAKFELA